MINFLRTWIEGVAIAVIIASIFEMLLPKGNIKKYVKIVLGIYVVFSIISPFVNSKALYDLNISDSIDDYTKNIESSSITASGDKQSSTEANLEKMYLEAFKKEITSTVEKQGYNVNDCIVEAIFDANNKNAGIKKIEIILDSKNSSIDENDTTNSNVEPVEIEEVKINIGNNTNSQSSSNSDYSEITASDIKNLKNYLSEHYEVDKKIINIQTR